MTTGYNIVGVATFKPAFHILPDYRRPSDRHYRRPNDPIVGVATNYRRSSDVSIGDPATHYRRSGDWIVLQTSG